jgi:hypothetical protein
MLVMTTACGGDDGSGPSESELAGTWRATKYELVSVANPSLKVDMVALGGTVTMTLSSSGAFTLVAQMPDEPAETFTGTWEASSEILTLDFVTGLSGDMQFDMSLSGNILTLSGADAEMDLDGDGQDEAAKVTIVLTRQ